MVPLTTNPARPFYLALEVMGTTATKYADLDYILLMPEEMTGVWGTPAWSDSAVESHVVTDSESAQSSGFLYMSRSSSDPSNRFYSIIPKIGFKGDAAWFLANASSRFVVVTAASDEAKECDYEHFIDQALFVDVMLRHRYRTSR